MRESFLFSSRAWRCEEEVAFECVEGVGVAESDLLGGIRRRRLDGEEGVSYGAVAVK
jgi:hypothetical protein